MNEAELRSVIEKAFAKVTLGDGISILQSEVIDAYGEGYTDTEFDELPQNEITNNWRALTLSDLDRCQVAHLDDKGFRYYIPALMCSLLKSYDISMRVIGTFRSLYPRNETTGLKEYILARYEVLDIPQRQAIALFLHNLPQIVQLEASDQKIVERALRNYWKNYLPQQ